MISTPVYADELREGLRLDGETLVVTGDSARAEFAPLNANRSATLTIRRSGGPYPRRGAVASFQGVTRSVVTSASWQVDPVKPLGLYFSQCSGQRLTVSLELSGDFDGPARFSVLAFTPRRDLASAILGNAILGAFELPARGLLPWAILGRSAVGHAQLSTVRALSTWYPIQGPATNIELDRGMTYNGFSGKADAGSLTVRVYNRLDPRSSGLRRGTPLVLMDDKMRRPLFTGAIESTRSTQAKDGTYALTISAADRLADLARRKKWQETRPAPVSWTEALEALWQEYPHALTARGADAPLIGDLVHESTYLDWSDIYAATAGVTWWVDRANMLRATDTVATEPVGSLAMGEGPRGPHSASPADVTAHTDTAEFVATLAAENHTAARNEEGKFEDHTETVTATNATLAASYGASTLTITTAAANAGALRNLLTRAVARYEPRQIITAASFAPWNAVQAVRDTNALDWLLSLDVLDPVRADYRGTTATIYPTHFKYAITPQTVEIALTFTQWKGM